MVAAVAHRTPEVPKPPRAPGKPPVGLREFAPLAFEAFCFPCARRMVQRGSWLVCERCGRSESGTEL